ncbi:MAG: ribonuclease III [Niabella sp.]|nr:MAG: ribonuclease III [Niabella sp.]
MSDLKNLEKKLNIQFNDPNILKKALTHRSYLNETSDKTVSESNERLEFLGDAVLQFLSSEYLFNNYPGYEEGVLTNIRSKIVNTQSLAAESKKLELSGFILISRGEKQTAYESDHILANTFEAILGAIYLDSKDIDLCRKFLLAHLFYKIDALVQEGQFKDSKSLYQEITQEKYGITPTYKVVSEEGPDHNKAFTVAVFLNERKIAHGSGSSKRRAEQEAASNALKVTE